MSRGIGGAESDGSKDVGGDKAINSQAGRLMQPWTPAEIATKPTKGARSPRPRFPAAPVSRKVSARKRTPLSTAVGNVGTVIADENR